MTSKNKNAVVILSHHMDANGVPGKETLARIELAVKIFQRDDFDFIITSGWDYRNDSELKIGDVVADTLVDHYSIDRQKVLVDVNSRDTVGDAFFVRRNLVTPLDITSITVVTSCYHLQRAEMIFRTFFSPTVSVKAVGVNLDLCNRNELLQHEERSSLAFTRTFDGVELSDDTQVFNTLASNHPFYNGEIHKLVTHCT